MLMRYSRIELREHRALPTARDRHVNVLTNVDGNETAIGIELGPVLIPWGLIALREGVAIVGEVPGNDPHAMRTFVSEGTGLPPAQVQPKKGGRAR